MIRVLVIDDSPVVRRTLAQELARDPEIEVVGAAPDPYVARELIARLRPHVLTLDIDMPRMDGLTFLGKLMAHHPLPVIVVSSLTPHGSELALRALELGAFEVLPKPESAAAIGELSAQLARTIQCAAMIDAGRLARDAGRLEQDARRLATPASPADGRAEMPACGAAALPGPGCPRTSAGAERIIAIGASTGGTQAVAEILRRFPADAPATLIVQHMPAGFTRAFAERLDRLSAMTVREAADGDALAPGVALVAPGNWHLTLRGCGSRARVRLSQEPRVHFQRPSVEALFDSLAQTAGKRTVGIILTGMGADGAEGLLRLRLAGAHTIAQDEATSVVFGMPREAIRRGAIEQVLPLGEIAAAALREDPARAAA